MSTSARSYGPSLLRRVTGPAAEMRVSDAERTEIADRLSKHYSDGRLDQTEFSERLDRAMSAKTQSDLAGLLADLPVTGGTPPKQQQPKRPQRSRGGSGLARILFLAFVIVVAVAAGQALLHMYLLWIIVALAVFLVVKYGRRQRN